MIDSDPYFVARNALGQLLYSALQRAGTRPSPDEQVFLAEWMAEDQQAALMLRFEALVPPTRGLIAPIVTVKRAHSTPLRDRMFGRLESD